MGNKNLSVCPMNNLASQSSLIDELFKSQTKSLRHYSKTLAKMNANIKFQSHFNIGKSNRVTVTESIVEIFTHPNFYQQSFQWYSALIQYIGKLNKKKSILFINPDEWMLCLSLSQFVMLCCDEEIRWAINEKEVIKISKNWQEGRKQERTFTRSRFISSISNQLSSLKLLQCRTILRDFIYSSIKIKNNMLAFDTSFTKIYHSVECLLNLFAKLQYLCIQKQNIKKDITICAYAIGLGIDYNHPYVVNLAIKLAYRIYYTFRKNPQQLINLKLNSIPTHYYKDIPIFTCNNLHQTVATYLLYILCFKRKDIFLSDLIELFMIIVETCNPMNREILYFLQKLCQIQQISSTADQEIIGRLIIQYTQLGKKTTQKIKKHLENRIKYSKMFFQEEIQNQKKSQSNNITCTNISLVQQNEQQSNDQHFQWLCYSIVTNRYMGKLNSLVQNNIQVQVQDSTPQSQNKTIKLMEENTIKKQKVRSRYHIIEDFKKQLYLQKSMEKDLEEQRGKAKNSYKYSEVNSNSTLNKFSQINIEDQVQSIQF